MYGTLDISTSGLIAQRTRLEAITTNIANANALLDGAGRNNPFQKRVAHFAAGDPTARTAAGREGGVHVAAIESLPGHDLRHDPSSPYADANGYVKVPNINVTMEMLDGYEAQRAYEANVVAAEATKTMMAQVLRLLA